MGKCATLKKALARALAGTWRRLTDWSLQPRQGWAYQQRCLAENVETVDRRRDAEKPTKPRLHSRLFWKHASALLYRRSALQVPRMWALQVLHEPSQVEQCRAHAFGPLRSHCTQYRTTTPVACISLCFAAACIDARTVHSSRSDEGGRSTATADRLHEEPSGR